MTQCVSFLLPECLLGSTKLVIHTKHTRASCYLHEHNVSAVSQSSQPHRARWADREENRARGEPSERRIEASERALESEGNLKPSIGIWNWKSESESELEKSICFLRPEDHELQKVDWQAGKGRITQKCMPGKCLQIMALGRPVLISSDLQHFLSFSNDSFSWTWNDCGTRLQRDCNECGTSLQRVWNESLLGCRFAQSPHPPPAL